MPSRAIESVAIDYIASVEHIPALILREGHGQSAMEGFNLEELSTELTCPECRGPLKGISDWQINLVPLPRWPRLLSPGICS